LVWLAALFGYDFVTRRTPHPATIFGSLGIVLMYVPVFLVGADGTRRVVEWLTSNPLD
jgi:hypothetical protein